MSRDIQQNNDSLGFPPVFPPLLPSFALSPILALMGENKANPLVGIIMGSVSDYAVLEHCGRLLSELGVPYEEKIVSAHRTPQRLYDYAGGAKARGLRVVIAAAGGAAHLPGMTASMTTLPVLGVPVAGRSGLGGVDSLLSIVQMPRGVPVGTLAIGEAGAVNAALLAASILALEDAELAKRLEAWRKQQSESVPETPPSA